jgi:hypothetical protein
MGEWGFGFHGRSELREAGKSAGRKVMKGAGRVNLRRRHKCPTCLAFSVFIDIV